MNHEPLRLAREARKISLEGMASRIGMDKGNLSKVENGNCGRTKLREVAMLYDVELGNKPYTLVRECGALNANLLERIGGTGGLLALLKQTRCFISRTPAQVAA